MQNRNEENSYNEKKYSEETYGERKQEKPRDQERNSEEGMRSTDHKVIPETDNHVSGGKRPWSEEGRHGISRQGAILITSLCLVAAAGFATFYTMDAIQKTQEEQRQLEEQNARIKEEEAQKRQKAQEELAAAESEAAARMAASDDATAELGDTEKTGDVDGTENGTEDGREKTADGETDQAEDAAAASSGQVQAELSVINPTVSYEDTTPLAWPVAGNLLMDYSMNSTVYFETLNQYKYNPALVIGSNVGNQVVAAAKGIVEKISVEDETGTTLTLNLGNNYELIYGQLKELAVKEGDVVETGQLLGYISEPTKYYCKEGSNLFFEMKKDGEPVDPFLYLE